MGWQAPPADDLERRRGRSAARRSSAGAESSRLAQRLRDEERLVSVDHDELLGADGRRHRDPAGRARGQGSRAGRADRPRGDRADAGDRVRPRRSGSWPSSKFESQHAFDTETSEGLANAYALAETTWTLEAELGYVDRLRKITREQIRDAARRYLSRTDYAQIAFVPRSHEPPLARRRARRRARGARPPRRAGLAPPPPRRAPSRAPGSPTA